MPVQPHSQSHLLRNLSFLCFTVAVLFYLTCIQLAGGSVLDFGLYLLLSGVLLVLPGLFVCDALLPTLTGAGRFVCAYALGLAVLLASFMVVGSFAVPPTALFVLPSALGLCQLWRILRRKKQRISMTWSTQASLLLLCFAGALCVYAFTGVLGFAHASAAGNMVYHQDMMWSTGNGAAVQFGFPLRDIRAAGGFLYYHYASDALPGLLALAGNLLPFDAACYYNYPLILAFLVPALYAAAKAYGAKPLWAAVLPFAVLFLNGYGSQNIVDMLRNINGVAPAALLTCVLLFLLFWAEKQKFNVNWRFYVAFSAVMAVLLLSKNLYAILLLCALAAAVVVGGMIQRKWFTTPLCLAILGFGIFGVCWFFLFRHAINNLVFSLWQSAWEIPKTLAIWLPLGFALYLISLFLSVRSLKTLSFGRLVVHAATLGGLLAYLLFQHYSRSQIYFFLAAILFLWFCVLDTLPLLEHAPWLRWAAGTLAVISLGGTLLTLAPIGQKGVQVALRCMGLRPAYPHIEETITPGDEAAALWLRENMASTDVFAVNRNAKYAAVGEGTWHYYTAMSGRQAFVESWRYAMDYGFDYHELRHNLEQVSDVIFAKETADEAFALAREYQIRYLVFSRPLRESPLAGATPVYENEAVRIYETP